MAVTTRASPPRRALRRRRRKKFHDACDSAGRPMISDPTFVDAVELGPRRYVGHIDGDEHQVASREIDALKTRVDVVQDLLYVVGKGRSTSGVPSASTGNCPEMKAKPPWLATCE
jgi:hypothetical protein